MFCTELQVGKQLLGKHQNDTLTMVFYQFGSLFWSAIFWSCWIF